MKKILINFIAFAIVFSTSITAFGAEKNQSIDVTAKTNDDNVTEAVIYSVDISWDDMTFTYLESGSKMWNAETHTYVTNTSGGWDKTMADIRITNHSNTVIDVSVTYSGVEHTGIVGTITNGTATLQAGVEGKPKEADNVTATFTISGTPSAMVKESGVKIGSITVKIS